MDVGFNSSSLPRLRILQVGDVHYPEWVSAPAEIDLKTNQLSKSVTNALTTDGFQNLLRHLANQDFLDACDAVVFMGDFTSRGDQSQLSRGIRHLAQLFRVNPHSAAPKFHAVPGNHDVGRDNARKLGLIGKFGPMTEELRALGFSTPAPMAPNAVQIGDGARPVKLILTNTTLGSWETVGLPDAVARWIETVPGGPSVVSPNLVDDQVVSIPIIDPSSYYDQLDTPFIANDVIRQIKHIVSTDDQQSLPCIVGHHNVLPQATPRVSPFGELLNQGELRSTLLALNRPALYLHGHIHTDPVEILTSPSFPKAKLVCVSAPCIWQGVNVIDVFFSRAGEPLGIAIHPLRVDKSGHVNMGAASTIPLRAGASVISTNLAAQTFHHISAGRCAWSELVSKVGCSEDDLEGAILELAWGSQVSILNQTAPRQRWVLEAFQ